MNGMQPLALMLVLGGLALVLIGGLLLVAGRIPFLGRLPGTSASTWVVFASTPHWPRRCC